MNINFKKPTGMSRAWRALFLASCTTLACHKGAPPARQAEKPKAALCPGGSLSDALFGGLGLPCPKAGKKLASDYNSLTMKVDGNVGKKNDFVEAEELFEEVFNHRPAYRPVIQDLHRAGLEDPFEERAEIKDFVLQLFKKFQPQTELDKAILLFRAVIPPSQSFTVNGVSYRGLTIKEGGLALPLDFGLLAPLRRKYGDLLPKELIGSPPPDRVAACLEYSHLLVSLLRAAGFEAHTNGKTVPSHAYTIANLRGQKYKLDAVKTVVARRNLLKILGETDASWQAFFINPNEEILTFVPTVEEKIRRMIKDPIKRAKILTVFQQSQQLTFEPTATGAGTDRESIALHYNNEGASLAEQGKIPEALDAVNKALEIDPNCAAAWNCKGATLQRQGKLTEALEAVNKALEIDPNFAAAWNGKGVVLLKRENLSEALGALDKALEINPNDAEAWSNKGAVLFAQGKRPEALEAWRNKGVALAKQGKFIEALEAFNKVLEINPNYAEAWRGKGIVLAKQGKLTEALEAYNKALEINPNYADAWNNKGVVLAKQGKFPEALEAFNKALEINPNYADAWNNKGGGLVAQGKLPEAFEAYNKALEINPNDAEAWSSKGVVLAKQGKFPEALEALDKALEINPNYAEAWSGKGAVLLKQGKPTEALEALNKALEINPNDTVAWTGKGVTFKKQGKLTEALEALDKALEIDPNLAHAWFHKGDVFANQGKLNEAIRAYNKALEINPNEAEAWFNKGNVLKKQGNLDEAEKCFKRAKELGLDAPHP